MYSMLEGDKCYVEEINQGRGVSVYVWKGVF